MDGVRARSYVSFPMTSSVGRLARDATDPIRTLPLVVEMWGAPRVALEGVKRDGDFDAALGPDYFANAPKAPFSLGAA